MHKVVLLCFERFLPRDDSQFFYSFFILIDYHSLSFSTFSCISGTGVASFCCFPYPFELSRMVLQIGDEAQLFGNVEEVLSHFLQTLDMEVSAVGLLMAYPEDSSCSLGRRDVLFYPRWHYLARSAEEVANVKLYLLRRCYAVFSSRE